MNLQELKESGRIIFECISGSWAYNTNIPTSDKDTRGFYINPSTEYLGLQEPSGQINDEKHDITYYSLKRAFELLQTANPNMIELLWIPDSCILTQTDKMKELIRNRDLFISKKCFYTHIGYAQAQIQKARGQNKKVHNPMPETMPVKEDFCWLIRGNDFRGVRHLDINSSIFPFRPVSLKEVDIDLSRYHVAALEHGVNCFRLYRYGDKAKGVFRGNDMLVCESIPIDDEWDRFEGILIYNQDAYEKAIKDWHSYWDWMRNRNEARWVDQEKGKLNYDQKNMMHCMRLLISGENILRHGYPIVRFEGAQRDYLMKIRAGELAYEEIMKEVEEKVKKLEELKETSTIPHSVDVAKIEQLYRGLSA